MLVFRSYWRPRGHGSMRKPLEIITVLRMQNIMEIHKKNICFVTKSLFGKKIKSSFGALGLKSPHGGAIMSEATQKGSWLVVDQCAHFDYCRRTQACIPEQVTAANRWCTSAATGHGTSVATGHRMSAALQCSAMSWPHGGTKQQ